MPPVWPLHLPGRCRAWLGIAVGRAGRFPRIWAVRSRAFPSGWASLPRECSTTELRQLSSFIRWSRPHPLPRECSTTELRQRKGGARGTPRTRRKLPQGGWWCKDCSAAAPALGAPHIAVRCSMNDRDNRAPGRRAPRPDRAERLAAALRANLKRRKAQARGRANTPAGEDQSENRSNQPRPKSKDG